MDLQRILTEFTIARHTFQITGLAFVFAALVASLAVLILVQCRKRWQYRKWRDDRVELDELRQRCPRCYSLKDPSAVVAFIRLPFYDLRSCDDGATWLAYDPQGHLLGPAEKCQPSLPEQRKRLDKLSRWCQKNIKRRCRHWPDLWQALKSLGFDLVFLEHSAHPVNLQSQNDLVSGETGGNLPDSDQGQEEVGESKTLATDGQDGGQED